MGPNDSIILHFIQQGTALCYSNDTCQRDGLSKAANNVTGVDVVAAKDLSAEDLAPGGDIGRLTVWTKSAIEALE